MPRAFDITPSTPKLRLKSGESGEIAFTVSNKTDGPVRAKAVARPESETEAISVSIPGGDERDFAKDETQLITVKVQAPASAKEGSYPIHMVVSALSNPDELYALSGTIPIEVTHVEQKFPWWIVMLAGGVLLIGGLIFGLVKVLGDEGGPLGSNCTADESCASDLRCVEVKPGVKSCLLKPGEECAGDLQCASAFCRPDNKECSRDDGKCTPETAAQDCRPGTFQCTNNRCLLVNGQRCQSDGECASNFCAGSCIPCSVPCTPPFTCFRNQCVLSGFPRQSGTVQEFRRFQGIQQ